MARSNSGFNFKSALLAVVAVILFASCFFTDAGAKTAFTTETCGAGGPQDLPQIRDDKKNLIVAGPCFVKGTLDHGKSLPFVFHNVNVINSGQLIFQEGNPIDFWAESILIENKGSLTAVSSNAIVGYGSRLTIHLWGAPGGADDDDVNVGIDCKTVQTDGPKGAGPCGIPNELWIANPGMADHLMMDKPTPPSHPKNKDCVHIGGYDVELPGNECFYQYEVQDLVDRKKGVKGYFGHKVLAVSFGGTLQLAGAKGSLFTPPKLKCIPTEAGNECNPSTTGKSWVRLTGVDKETSTIITLNGMVDWKQGDHIVVTTTDYLPGHSEEAVLAEGAKYDDVTKTAKVTLTAALRWQHNASVYALPPVDPTNGPSAEIGPQDDTNNRPDVVHAVDTRAAVGLLTRDIQIVSEGDTAQPDGMDNFPAKKGNYYGGHTIVRQGVALYQVQGVEFRRLGQGGAIGRYPVHFHMLRRTAQPVKSDDPPINYLKDCSINESMTRWVVLHATQGMYVARNVAYKSIGHGFYLEDATEIDNKVYANLGVMARAAVINDQNPRQVPGILADTSETKPANLDLTPYRSDFNHPTVFWIMNGWNDFQYNFAAGAATCGVCYWWLPGGNSGPSQYQHWDGYASQQIWDPAGDTSNDNNFPAAGYSPLKNFVGNTCVAAMTSFQTVGASNDCNGVPASGGTDLAAVPTKAPVPDYENVKTFDLYYPTVTGLHNATTCDVANVPGANCSAPPKPVCSNQAPSECAATVIDRYTTSFNWAQTNFAAVWLRPKWYLVSNSAITDVQTGGLNFVTGGGYSRSDVPVGFWAVVRKSAFIGHSQPYTNGNFPANPFASDAGPFNPESDPPLDCDNTTTGYCVSKAEGISFQLPPFPGQRLFNIYDGPAFQEDNFYLDVNTTTTDCHPGESGRCDNSKYPWTRNLGVLKDGQECYLPNAAIAWKQPNGFYYPPAFNSRKLWFENVDIRHFVVEPLFVFDPKDPYNPFVQNQTKIKTRYCTYNNDTFNTFNHIDRQTVLNDDDGSLTGLLAIENDPNHKKPPVTRATISVNEDPYFNSPLITPECLSDKGVAPLNPNKRTFTAYTSPYEWLSTAITAGCAQAKPPETPNKAQCLDDKLVIHWAHECTMPNCRGVPLYREYLTDAETGTQPQIRMMGLDTAQRSTLTVNHGAYYIDTTQNCTSQAPGGCSTCQPNPEKPNDCIVTGKWRQTIFQGGQTYYVLFIYAKPSTHQTYDIYVGPGLEDQLKVTPVRVNVTGGFEFRDDDNGGWVTIMTKPDQVPGVVRVTVDLSGEDDVFKKSKPKFCQPASFCEVKPSGACGCAPGNPQCTDAVCAWGSHELDCPMDPKDLNKMGCYGFSFTMPGGKDGFHAPDLPIPPPAKLFVNYTENPFFVRDVVQFSNTVAKSGGGCNYPDVPKQP